MEWLFNHSSEIIIGALFLDRVLEEIPEETPVIGKYKGVVRPVIKAILKVAGRKRKP